MCYNYRLSVAILIIIFSLKITVVLGIIEDILKGAEVGSEQNGTYSIQTVRLRI